MGAQASSLPGRRGSRSNPTRTPPKQCTSRPSWSTGSCHSMASGTFVSQRNRTAGLDPVAKSLVGRMTSPSSSAKTRRAPCTRASGDPDSRGGIFRLACAQAYSSPRDRELRVDMRTVRRSGADENFQVGPAIYQMAHMNGSSYRRTTDLLGNGQDLVSRKLKTVQSCNHVTKVFGCSSAGQHLAETAT